MLDFPHPQIHPGSLAQLLKNATRFLGASHLSTQKNRGKENLTSIFGTSHTV